MRTLDTPGLLLFSLTFVLVIAVQTGRIPVALAVVGIAIGLVLSVTWRVVGRWPARRH